MRGGSRKKGLVSAYETRPPSQSWMHQPMQDILGLIAKSGGCAQNVHACTFTWDRRRMQLEGCRGSIPALPGSLQGACTRFLVSGT
jgi:hypothetical protein